MTFAMTWRREYNLKSPWHTSVYQSVVIVAENAIPQVCCIRKNTHLEQFDLLLGS